jgi:rubrerythrin
MNEDINVKEVKTPRKSTTKPKVETLIIEESLSSDDLNVEETQENEIEIEKEKEKKEKVKKIRTLCKLVKRDYLKKNFKEFQELVTEPLFICRKCGRVAKEKQYLCRPVLILMEAEEKE